MNSINLSSDNCYQILQKIFSKSDQFSRLSSSSSLRFFVQNLIKFDQEFFATIIPTKSQTDLEDFMMKIIFLMKRNPSVAKLRQSIEDEKDFDENLKQHILKFAQFHELRWNKTSALRVISNQYDRLQNYDWSLVYSICNDKMRDVKTLLVRLSFIIVPSSSSSSNHQKYVIKFELTKTELKKFIETLLNCRRDLNDHLRKISI
ncbi:hypothetical protein SSS_05474 [Sarcoptes scabiei]|uniref:COMM domain-containing protein n=1 Tax=Sarcoptes scabiei TaxID=52283 RepID=A0A834RE51_SARSC|nr:hypothetical protein SSS_05474 [Sarcoptes scabiei]